MDILKDPYLILGRKVSSFLGFWLTQSYKERFLRSCMVGFSLVYAILAQLCQLFTLDFNLRSIVLALQMFLPFVFTVNIYYTIMLHFVTVQTVFSWVVQDLQQLKDEIELKIMQKHMRESKLFVTICGSMFFLYISFSILPSILHIILSTNKVTISTDRYPIYSCFDYFLGQQHYFYPIIIYQILTVGIMTTVATACYATYFWYIQHACARLSIVKNKLHRPFINNRHSDNVVAIPNDCSDWMIDNIQHLTRTVQFMALVNKLSENSYLFQMSLAFVLIVVDLLCLFQMPSLLKHNEERKNAFAFVLFIFAGFIPTYLNCHVGQKIMNSSTDVYREVCLVPIHEISLKTQKLLLTTLMMNTKPCAISIGKMFVSSHAFFSDLMRTSLSFAMVLHSMQM